jgi:hypothetical protein
MDQHSHRRARLRVLEGPPPVWRALQRSPMRLRPAWQRRPPCRQDLANGLPRSLHARYEVAERHHVRVLAPADVTLTRR